MHDRVLGFLRETMLHENEVEDLSIDFAKGQIRLRLLQPDEKLSWPDHELTLTFSGVREFSARSAGHTEQQTFTLLDMECRNAKPGEYRVTISVGESEASSWSLFLSFADLHYQRK
jgi:hypothetical protein